MAYCASDLGLVRLPHPTVMYAVPVKWWRLWQPYGGAVAYWAALGTGFATFIPFGAFYVVCLLCMLQSDPLYGALLVGTYGAARALVIFPVSLAAPRSSRMPDWLAQVASQMQNAMSIVSATTVLFGTTAITSGLLMGLSPRL